MAEVAVTSVSGGDDASSSNSTTTKKVVRQTITTIETDQSSSLDASYRPHLQARSIVIQRTGAQYGAAAGSRNNQSRERSLSYQTVGNTSANFQALSTKGVLDVTSSRHKEKKDMQDLNERLANYIEKVRFLEAQNRRLADELEKLKAKWGKETEMVKAMYEAELAEARRLLDDAVKDKSRLEIRVTSIEEYTEDLKLRLEAALKDAAESRERADRNNQQLSDYEGELALLRRRLESLEGDRDKEKGLLKRLQDALNAARSDLDNETLLHIDAENRRQTLEEELAFLRAVHEQELKELQAMAYRDTTSENREYWKSEMGQALREIQQTYDDKLDGMRGELEGYYNLKVQEQRTGAVRNNMDVGQSKEESKRLKTQLGSTRDKLTDLEARNLALQRELDLLRREKEERERELETENEELKITVARLRAEMEAMLKELEHIIDTKLGLELEISAYRKLLEGEETRVSRRGVYDADSQFSQDHSFAGFDSATSSTVTRGEMSARTTFQKSAKGPIAISECSAEGSFIILDNTGRKEESLGGWKLKRAIDGEEKTEFTFDESFVIKSSEKLKIWGQGLRPAEAVGDLEYSEATWGVGSNITTRLVNPAGEDRATHIQKVNYS
jgi:intermediate filament protein if